VNYPKKQYHMTWLNVDKKTRSFSNLHIIWTVWTGKLWHRVESYHTCPLFKAYYGERTWKAIGDRLQRPHYLSRADHERKIRSRRQRMDIAKCSFVNRTIQHWNQLPAEVLGTLPCKPITFKKRVRKGDNWVELKGSKVCWKSSKSVEKQSLVKWKF